MVIKSPAFIQAVKNQKEAANPVATRLASANAGSGKTRVLVNRVSRLLLTGTEPDKILCLTYTKAAASEMQTRLFNTLGDWSIAPEADLIKQLRELLPENNPLPELSTARRLFAKALETPEGLKVQTIHAFCERILSRFPIEAGILPGFDPIDDADMRALQEDVRKSLLREAASNPKGELNIALQILAAEKADRTLDDLFKWMAYSPNKIEAWAAAGTAELAKNLGLKEGETVEDIKKDAWDGAPKTDLKHAASGMIVSGKPKEELNGELIIKALAEPDRVTAFDIYAKAILKSNMTPNSQIVSGASGEAAKAVFGGWNKIDTPENARMAEAGQKILAMKTLSMTRAMLTLAIDYAARFKHAKYIRRGLDFNDQILLVRSLLLERTVSDWVRYKLDGGIEHILVDEAQDTSPEQWDIIDALSAAFIQDSPDRDKRFPRTLFAVGDEKQSIYSFQGARPERFLDQIQSYVGEDNKAVGMRMSFRSAPEILSSVDAFLNGPSDGTGALMRMFDVEEFAPASDKSVHMAFRKDHGRVDFWPPIPRPEKDEENKPWDTSPVDSLGKMDAREQLASAIAKQIRKWIDDGEPIFDRELSGAHKKDMTRPVTAGDILILVRKRSAFFEAVIRNLKAERVPVAGADRLTLKDSVAVKDLLSLAKFVLLPSDDLSLAEVLKSPLFGWTEDELFEAAYGRDGSLWSAVCVSRPETAAPLQDMIDHSRCFAPYEFFARVLDMVDESGDSIQKKIFKRLSLEAKDAIDAFLARALAHQRRGFPSLQHFIQSFLQDEQEIKRDMDMGTGQVRVMTVHGAKGLEAPIVFLPDTTQKPKFNETVLPLEPGYVLSQSKNDTPAAIAAYKDRAEARKMQEYLRLLYVAMTRAESRLVVCGFKHGQGEGRVDPESWYKEVEMALERLETQPLDTPFEGGVTFGQTAASYEGQSKTDQGSRADLPNWIKEPAPKEAPASRRVTPSHLLAGSANDMPVRSPLAADPQTRFQRGNLIHKLLEILPDIPVDARQEVARKILSGFRDIDSAQIMTEVFAVLDNPDFADIFAPNSRAEISLAGTAKSLPDHLYLNAQIDRISVTDDTVFIVDYKSNRPPPQTQDGVADLYWGQMAAYRELAREIYPGREVVCALLWTDGPRLMVLDENRLDEALTQIAALPT